jgi:hypothetical protein
LDKDGKVYYGDRPPQSVESERMQVDPTDVPERPDEGDLQRRRLLEQAEKAAQRRIEARRARTASKQAERQRRLAKEQQCLQARKQLALLQALHLPAYRDEEGKFRAKWKYDTYQGEHEYLDDATRVSVIECARQEVAMKCQRPDDVDAQNLARRQWIRSERCAAARAELELLERPRARTPRQTLEEKRQRAEMYCKE